MATPFDPLIQQINALSAQRQSPESAALQARLMQQIQEQTRQNLASDYLATADFSKNPASSLRMLGSILNNPDLIRSSLDVQMKADAFELDKKRLQDLQAAIESGDPNKIAAQAAVSGQQGLAIETLGRANRERLGREYGEAVATGEKAPTLAAAGAFGDTELLQKGARPSLMTEPEKQLEQAEIDLKRSQTAENLARAKALSEPQEKPLTAPQKANLVRQLGKDVSQSAPVKDFLEMRSQAAKVNDVLDSTQSQLNRNIKQQTVLTTFQKMLDPLSVVRESEFIRTQQMQGLVDSVISKIQSAVQGGAVTDETVRSIREAVNIIGARAQKFANEEVEKGRSRGNEFGIDNLDLIAKPYSYFPEALENFKPGESQTTGQTFKSSQGEINETEIRDKLKLLRRKE